MHWYGLCSRLFASSLLIALFTNVGCGRISDAPPLVPVSGRVLVDGEPIARLSVIFAPDNQKGTTGPASVGTTSTDGGFTLTAPGNRSGAVAGFHRVTVSCPFDPSSGSDPSGQKAAGGGCSLPAVYADPLLTPLSLEVRATTDAAGPLLIEISRTTESK